MKVQLYEYKIPLVTPLKFSRGILNFRQGILIETLDDFAEVSPLPFFSKESYADVIHEIQKLQISLINNQHFEAKFPSVKFAQFCINNPVNQYKNSKPYNFFIGETYKVHQEIKCNLDNKEYNEKLPIFKIKIGIYNIDEELNLVTHLSTLKAKFILDSNCTQSTENIIKFCSILRDKLLYIEDPCNQYKELLKRRIPIAIDEILRNNPKLLNEKNTIKIIKPTMMDISTVDLSQNNIVLSSSFESCVAINYIEKLSTKYNLHSPGTDTLKYFPDDSRTINGLLSKYVRKLK